MTDSMLQEVNISDPPYQNGKYDAGDKKGDQDGMNRLHFCSVNYMAKADPSGGWEKDTVGEGWTVEQGCFHTGYPPSAGTHDGSGVYDLNGTYEPGLKQENLAKVGMIYFYRTAADGFPVHGHTVAVGNTDLQWLARAQVSSFYAGRNGLANNGPFRLAPGVNAIPTLTKWVDPWKGEKPPPPAELWPAWSDWPGYDKTGWGPGNNSSPNLQISCALGIRGYAGGYADNVNWTWDVPAMQALQRWQDNHQPWAGRNFEPDAWDALGRIPLIKHDTANETEVYENGAHKFGVPSHESFFIQMLLVLQGFQVQLNQHATRIWRPNAVVALKAFQSHVGVTVDGIPGPVTWGKLWDTHK